MSGNEIPRLELAETIRYTFPRSFLAQSDAASHAWRENFIQTFLERDLRMFGVQVPPMG
jgi:uncharacterized protein